MKERKKKAKERRTFKKNCVTRTGLVVNNEVGNVDLKFQTKTFRLYSVISEEPQKSLLNNRSF